MTGPAGYSGTPLARKLGVKPGDRVALVGAPAGFEALLEPLPDGATTTRRAAGRLDAVLLFTTRRADLERRAPRLAEVAGARGLWICWPKGASGVPTDVDREVVRAVGLATGLVDVKVAALDATWSGLRFLRRRAG